jgi:hypothetical protein
MALESNTEIDKAFDSTNRPLYVRKGVNSRTRFSAALQLCFFMKTLAIVLVGGAAKIAADGIFGVLTLLCLYTRPKGRVKKIFVVCPSTSVEAAWQGEASGLLLPFGGAKRGV